MSTTYRIDKACGAIFSEENGAYHFYLSFYQIGAIARDSEKTILKKLHSYRDQKGE